jgi:hypothetical protein
MYAHKTLMTSNSIAVTDLKQKTQNLIAKFEAETDEEKREALDEKIHGDVEDFIEEKTAKEKADAKKATFAASKEAAKAAGKVDISAAPTAAPATPAAAEPAKPAKSIMHRAFGF